MSQSLSAPYFISYCVSPLCLDTQWRPSLYRPRVPSSPRKKSLLVIIMTLWVSDLCKRRDNGLGKRWPVFKVRGVSCCAGWRDRPAPTLITNTWYIGTMTPHSRDLCSSVLAAPPPGAFLFPLVQRVYQNSLLIYFTNFSASGSI